MTPLQWLTWLAIALALAGNALAYRVHQATLRDLEAVRLRTFGLEMERDLAWQREQTLREICRWGEAR